MNKGRSRMFSERMKGVFKSRSRVANSKIPDNRNAGTDSHSRISEIKYNSKDGSIQPFTVASSSCYGIINAKSGNENVEVMEDKSYKSINEDPSGSRNEGKCVLSSHNELHIKPNVIDESCQSCLPNADINQNSSHLMNGRWKLSQKMTVSEGTFNNNNNTNNNNNYYSSLRVPKSYRCGVGICHYCLKQICVCENGNGISNNNFHSLDGSFRFSQVLQNAFGEEKNNRNEFIILALGIQHYIKEVFDALDYKNNGYVYYEDLQILCKLLGKDLEYESNSDVSFSSCDLDNNDNQKCAINSCKTHLHFGKFSEIIRNKFSKVSDTTCLEKRKNSQLVNAVVNISRRSESLSVLSKQLEELEKDYLDFKNKNKYFTLPNINNSINNCKSCTKYQLMEGKNNSNNNHLENMKLQKIILLQQQELQCLREVIEDLRISLQCSDAENLSLRVKEVKSRRNSLSDDQISKAFTLSTDDDKDSIDRIIQNFPSNEDLNMSSNESLLTIRSLQSRSPNRSLNQIKSNQIDIDSRSNLLSQKILERMGDDDLGLNKEIQLVYRELSDTRSELEDTRTDLENTVSEIQTKNDQINRLIRNLNEMKINFDKSVEENSNLKEKIILLKNIEKNKATQIDILEQQVFELKSELNATDGQIKVLSNDLQNLQLKRKKDLQQMTRARNLIAKSLHVVAVNRNENSENSKAIKIPKKFPANSDAIFGNNSRIIGSEIINYSNCDNNNNNNTNVNSNYKRTVTFNTELNDCNKNVHYNKETININDKSVNFYCTNNSSISNSDNLKKLSSNYQQISDNKFHTKEQSRLNLSPCNSRRSEFNVNNIPIVTKKANKVDNIQNDLSNGTRSPSPPEVHQKDKPRSLDGSSVPEDKPILEVKPNLIRPIGIMKPILKNPPPIPQSSRSSSLEDLKPYSNQESEFQNKYSSLKLNRHKESEKLSPLNKDGERTEILDCKPQNKTSTQILEGLEAEVEYLLSMF